MQPIERKPLDREAALAAIKSGEGIEVVYLRGSQPGKKRLIFPRGVRGNLLYAQDVTAGGIRSFNLDALQLCVENDPAPAAKSKSQPRAISDPAQFFSAWHYEIRPAHYPAVGVVKRTRQGRVSLAFGGEEHAELHQGDTFLHKTAPYALQVVQIKEELEVHLVFLNLDARHAYRITTDTFIEWLETGAVPGGRIEPMQSSFQVVFSALLKGEKIEQEEDFF